MLRNTSERWNQITRKYGFENQEIHAYLEAFREGDTIALHRNFSLNFPKSITTNLQLLCKDCSLTLQSKEAFKDKMPYIINKMISERFMYMQEKETFSYVSFSYERPINDTKFLKTIDPRVLEKITNKETKQLTVYFTMQAAHLSYRALNLAHNLVFM